MNKQSKYNQIILNKENVINIIYKIYLELLYYNKPLLPKELNGMFLKILILLIEDVNIANILFNETIEFILIAHTSISNFQPWLSYNFPWKNKWVADLPEELSYSYYSSIFFSNSKKECKRQKNVFNGNNHNSEKNLNYNHIAANYNITYSNDSYFNQKKYNDLSVLNNYEENFNLKDNIISFKEKNNLCQEFVNVDRNFNTSNLKKNLESDFSDLNKFDYIKEENSDNEIYYSASTSPCEALVDNSFIHCYDNNDSNISKLKNKFNKKKNFNKNALHKSLSFDYKTNDLKIKHTNNTSEIFSFTLIELKYDLTDLIYDLINILMTCVKEFYHMIGIKHCINIVNILSIPNIAVKSKILQLIGECILSLNKKGNELMNNEFFWFLSYMIHQQNINSNIIYIFNSLKFSSDVDYETNNNLYYCLLLMSSLEPSFYDIKLSIYILNIIEKKINIYPYNYILIENGVSEILCNFLHILFKVSFKNTLKDHDKLINLKKNDFNDSNIGILFLSICKIFQKISLQSFFSIQKEHYNYFKHMIILLHCFDSRQNYLNSNDPCISYLSSYINYNIYYTIIDQLLVSHLYHESTNLLHKTRVENFLRYMLSLSLFPCQFFDYSLKIVSKIMDMILLQSPLVCNMYKFIYTLVSNFLTNLIFQCNNCTNFMKIIELINQKLSKQIIIQIFKKNKQQAFQIAASIYIMVVNHTLEFDHKDRITINQVLDMLQCCSIKVIRIGYMVTSEVHRNINLALKRCQINILNLQNRQLKEFGISWQKTIKRISNVNKLIEVVLKKIVEELKLQQTQITHNFTSHLRQNLILNFNSRQNLRTIIFALSHERGPWHKQIFSKKKFYQLDDTESPDGIRIRLKKWFPEIDQKFFMEQLIDGRDKNTFCFLFENNQNEESTALLYNLQDSLLVRYSCGCNMIKYNRAISGALLLTSDNLQYIADTAVIDIDLQQLFLENGENDLYIVIALKNIIEINKHCYMLEDKALELRLNNGYSYLLNFHNCQTRNKIYDTLRSTFLTHIPTVNDFFSNIYSKWLNGDITNFEYLICLNRISGRTQNDLMNYPIFPFVLAQYDESSLDLTDPLSYRKLDKTISTQYSCFEAKYTSDYKNLESQFNENNSDKTILHQPYHYHNYCSNIISVLQFNIRIEPFTSIFINFQGGSFDCADRCFHNIASTYQLASRNSASDTRELNPLFFAFPDFLKNINRLNLGTCQNGEIIDDVILPKWCNKDARLFILIHRQALESYICSQNLPHFIDLIFGIKQRGQMAIESYNVYHPATYYGLNFKDIDDPMTLNAVTSMLQTCGQVPKQIFKSHHLFPNLKNTKNNFKNKPKVLENIIGICWGNYLGSPDLFPPIIIFDILKDKLMKIATVSSDSVLAFPHNSTLVVKKMESGFKFGYISFNCCEKMFSLNRKNAITPLIKFYLKVTFFTTDIPSINFFIGTECGVVFIYHIHYLKEGISLVEHENCQLTGHIDSINKIIISNGFKIFVTCSDDCTAIIWDLNKLSYLFEITHSKAVKMSCISETLGDIVTVSYHGDSTQLYIHSINGFKIGQINIFGEISCITYSNAPEGRSVNALVAGFKDGSIRFWSSWDFKLLRELKPLNLSSRLISLVYSFDSQNLVTTNEDKMIKIWGTKNQYKSKLKIIFL